MPGISDISVVIPYYNRERYFDETVQSVLAQTLKPLEIIIVNDCSRASSRRYLDRYADFCRIVDLPVNVGLAGSRNAGIRHARGQFIAFLDDDDIWLPQKLEVQRRYMEDHPECAAVHCAVWAFFADGPDVLWRRDWPPPLTLAQALTHNYWVMIPTVLIRGEVVRALGGFDSRFRGSEDHEFVIRCCAAGYRIEAVYQPLARIRREGQDSLSERRWWMYTTHLRLFWKHKGLYQRAYGPRGMASFLIMALHLASCKTRYVRRAVRPLLQFIKYRIKPTFRDPVLSGNERQPVLVLLRPADRPNLAGGNSL